MREALGRARSHDPGAVCRLLIDGDAAASAAAVTAALHAHFDAEIHAVTPRHLWPDGSGQLVVERAGQAWLVRRFGPGRPFERVVGDGAVLAHLEQHQIAAERVVPTRTGDLAVRLDDGSLLVTELVPGVEPEGSADQLRQLGEILGRLHALDRPTGDRYLGRRAGSTPSEDLAFARTRLQQVAARVDRTQRSEHDRLHAALSATRDCDRCPSALIHPDAHAANSLVTSDGSVVLVDWDGAGRGPRIASLGWLLFDAGLRHPDGVEAVLEGWCRHQRPTPIELDHLGDAIRFRPLTHAVRSFAAAIEGQDQEPRWWGDRLEEAAPFAERARRVLLPLADA